MLGHQGIHLVGICDIRFEKLITIAVFLRDAVQIGQIAGIGKHIDIGDVSRLVMFQNVANKVAPYETAAARH